MYYPISSRIFGDAKVGSTTLRNERHRGQTHGRWPEKRQPYFVYLVLFYVQTAHRRSCERQWAWQTAQEPNLEIFTTQL